MNAVDQYVHFKGLLETPTAKRYGYRKLMRNTYLEWGPDDTVFVRFHSTNIMRFWPDGKVRLDSGGWQTLTTRGRMNEFLPSGWRICQDRGVWYLRCPFGRVQEWGFQDGLIIGADGDVTGAADVVATKALRKAVRAYASAYMKELVAGRLHVSLGDCLCCRFGWDDHDHIQSHLEERYYVPSLIVRASQVVPTSEYERYRIHVLTQAEQPEDAQKGGELTEKITGQNDSLDGWVNSRLRKIVTKYCYKCLGLAR